MNEASEPVSQLLLARDQSNKGRPLPPRPPVRDLPAAGTGGECVDELLIGGLPDDQAQFAADMAERGDEVTNSQIDRRFVRREKEQRHDLPVLEPTDRNL